MFKALSYAYRDRRDRKGQMRRLWIVRINAAAREAGLSYGRLIDGLTKAHVAIDRKMLADMALREPTAFQRIVDIAREQLAAQA
jgi:large subunit ribosomal protein L20